MRRIKASSWRLFLPLMAVALAIGVGLWLVPDPSGEPAFTDADERSAEQTDPTEPTARTRPEKSGEGTASGDANAAFETPESLGDEPFARSMQGTDIDGQLRADANGNLLVDRATRDFFDYFLNTVGEVSPETALNQIETLVRTHLPESAATEALAFLDSYLSYRREALELGNQSLDPGRQNDPAYQLTTFQQALADLKRLRRHAFEPDVHDAFFGLEEAYSDYTLANLELHQRKDLSDEARHTLQEWHRQQLPEVIRKTEQRLHGDAEIYQLRQAAIANAKSPEEAGEQLRKMGVASKEADAVTGYLRERQAFEVRFDSYQSELAQLREAGLAEEDFDTRQTQLLEQHFRNEQSRTWARLRNLDAANSDGGSPNPRSVPYCQFPGCVRSKLESMD